MPFLNHWYILLIVLAIVLIVYGPGKLPEVGGAIGKAMREFRKASSDLQDEFKKGSTTESSQDARPSGENTAPGVHPAPDVKSPTDTKA
jgi:sec-independent protein translocase protein TatA